MLAVSDAGAFAMDAFLTLHRQHAFHVGGAGVRGMYNLSIVDKQSYVGRENWDWPGYGRGVLFWALNFSG